MLPFSGDDENGLGNSNIGLGFRHFRRIIDAIDDILVKFWRGSEEWDLFVSGGFVACESRIAGCFVVVILAVDF